MLAASHAGLTLVVDVDLIAHLRADTVTWHRADTGAELHRAPIVDRTPLTYRATEAGRITARAWAGDQCVYQFGLLEVQTGDSYIVDFGPDDRRRENGTDV